MSDVRVIAGVPVRDTTFKPFCRYVFRCLKRRRKLIVLFANSHFVVSCQHLKESLGGANVLIVPDGLASDLACRWLYGSAFLSNMNGTDTVPALLRAMPNSVRVFLLGARPDVVASAAERFSTIEGVHIAGIQDGYSWHKGDKQLIERINESSPDVILVALGNPIQEEWILNEAEELCAPLIFGVGALFDFVAQHRKRAPTFIRRLRLEWLFRLLLEPRRLGRRYTIEIIEFASLVFWSHRRSKLPGMVRVGERVR